MKVMSPRAMGSQGEPPPGPNFTPRGGSTAERNPRITSTRKPAGIQRRSGPGVEALGRGLNLCLSVDSLKRRVFQICMLRSSPILSLSLSSWLSFKLGFFTQ